MTATTELAEYSELFWLLPRDDQLMAECARVAIETACAKADRLQATYMAIPPGILQLIGECFPAWLESRSPWAGLCASKRDPETGRVAIPVVNGCAHICLLYEDHAGPCGYATDIVAKHCPTYIERYHDTHTAIWLDAWAGHLTRIGAAS